MGKWIKGDNGEPIEVTTIEDEWARYSMKKPELLENMVEPEKVAVKVGCLEIRQREGSKLPWGVEILMDGEPVRKVRRLELSIEVHNATTVTIEYFV